MSIHWPSLLAVIPFALIVFFFYLVLFWTLPYNDGDTPKEYLKKVGFIHFVVIGLIGFLVWLGWALVYVTGNDFKTPVSIHQSK